MTDGEDREKHYQINNLMESDSYKGVIQHAKHCLSDWDADLFLYLFYFLQLFYVLEV